MVAGGRRAICPAGSGKYSFIFSLLLIVALSIAPFLGASAQTLPGSAQPGRAGEQVEPPTIPEPAVPPSVVPEVEPLQAPAGSEKIRFTLKEMRIEGATVYAPADLAPLHQDLSGKEISLADVFEVAQRITQKYRSDGYIISRAVVPAQRVEDGVVRIQVLEGFVDKVTIDGEAPTILRDYAEQIRASRPLKAADLERYLLLANDLPGVSARAVLAASPSVPQAADLDRQGGAEAVRRLRHLRQSRDEVCRALSDPAWRRAQLAARLRRADPGARDHRHRNGGAAPGRAVGDRSGRRRGHDRRASGQHQPLRPGLHPRGPGDRERKRDAVAERGASAHPQPVPELLRLQGRFDFRNLDSEILGVPMSEDRLRVLRVGGTYDVVDGFAGVNLVSVELSRGFDILDGGNGDIPSRANGESGFTKLNFAASRLQRITGNLNLLVAASGQYAFDPLLSSEEFGLGGPEFLRAFDPSEVVGDHGLAGRAELQYLVPLGFEFLQALQLYGFGDVGRIWNRNSGFGEAERATLASAGGGIRFTINDHVRGGIEVAVPVEGEVAAEEMHDDGSGDDPRVFGTLSVTF